MNRMWHSCEICFKISEIPNLITFPKLSHLLRYSSGNPEKFLWSSKKSWKLPWWISTIFIRPGKFFWVPLECLNNETVLDEKFQKMIWKNHLLEFWPPYFPLCHMAWESGWELNLNLCESEFWNFLDTHNKWCGMEFMISLLISIGFLIFDERPDADLKLNSRIMT